MDKTEKTINIKSIASVWETLLNQDVIYLPVLGPVYISKKPTKTLLSDLLSNSMTDEFLMYDKNKRWFNKKMDKILISDILCRNTDIFIPLVDKLRNVLKIFYYSNKTANQTNIDDAKTIFTKIMIRNELKGLFFYCFNEPDAKNKFICNNIYLKKINANDNLIAIPKNIYYYDQLSPEIQSTLGELGKEKDLINFSFLMKNIINDNINPDSIVCAVDNNKIIGAIGPLNIEKDAFGTCQLFPPNFGITKKMRRLGTGEALWKSAMSYAFKKGVEYSLVQNASGSSASRFYKKQGLINSGNIFYCQI